MRLEITKRAGLAVRAIAVLSPVGTRHKAADLAQVLGTTPGFMNQVISPLIKAGWVQSVPGPTGGYTLIPTTTDLSALQVIEAVDGPTSTGACVTEDRVCDSTAPCVLHEAWLAARSVLTRTLASTPVTQHYDDAYVDQSVATMTAKPTAPAMSDPPRETSPPGQTSGSTIGVTP